MEEHHTKESNIQVYFLKKLKNGEETFSLPRFKILRSRTLPNATVPTLSLKYLMIDRHRHYMKNDGKASKIHILSIII